MINNQPVIQLFVLKLFVPQYGKCWRMLFVPQIGHVILFLKMGNDFVPQQKECWFFLKQGELFYISFIKQNVPQYLSLTLKNVSIPQKQNIVYLSAICPSMWKMYLSPEGNCYLSLKMANAFVPQ